MVLQLPHELASDGDRTIDLLFGNPHDMPIPAYVEALKRHAEPQHPGWFAYRLSDPIATRVVADDLGSHTRPPFDPADVAMTNGGWGAIAVAIRMLTERGDEVIYYDPPSFIADRASTSPRSDVGATGSSTRSLRRDTGPRYPRGRSASRPVAA